MWVRCACVLFTTDSKLLFRLRESIHLSEFWLHRLITMQKKRTPHLEESVGPTIATSTAGCECCDTVIINPFHAMREISRLEALLLQAWIH
jgi:hypothetical protein